MTERCVTELMFQRLPAVHVVLPGMVRGIQNQRCARETMPRVLHDERTEVATLNR